MNVTPFRWTVAVVMSAALLAGAVGCGLFGGEKLAVLGDSITALSKDSLEKELGSYSVQIDGKFGARVDEMFGEAARLASDHPKKVIINLGTNDAIQKIPAPTTGANLRRVVDQFGGAECIGLVTVDEELTVYGAPRRGPAQAVNAQIAQIAAQNPKVHVIDWNKIVADNGGILAVTADGVHPNDAGKLLLAQAYQKMLDHC